MSTTARSERTSESSIVRPHGRHPLSMKPTLTRSGKKLSRNTNKDVLSQSRSSEGSSVPNSASQSCRTHSSTSFQGIQRPSPASLLQSTPNELRLRLSKSEPTSLYSRHFLAPQFISCLTWMEWDQEWPMPQKRPLSSRSLMARIGFTVPCRELGTELRRCSVLRLVGRFCGHRRHSRNDIRSHPRRPCLVGREKRSR
jgi:hypothetical protein